MDLANQTMSIKLTCKMCTKELEVPNQFAGKKAKCPYCMEVLDIPAAGSEPEPAVLGPASDRVSGPDPVLSDAHDGPEIAESPADVDQPTDAQALFSDAPRRIRHPNKDDIWEISLDEALHLAMAHNRVIRTGGSFLSPQNPLLTNPQQAASVFDPAIQESGVLLGLRGVEAALSEFDARFTSSMLWGRNETVQNNRFLSGGLAPGDTLVEETGIFSSRLDKQMATGGLFALRHDWNYSQNNVPSRLFESSFTGLLRAEYRQPLWAGSGVEFTRIAGALDRNVRGISGVARVR